MDEATFVILFLNGLTLLFYLTIEGVINYLIIFFIRCFKKFSSHKWDIQYNKYIFNLKQLMIYRVLTAIILVIVILIISDIVGRHLYSYKSMTSCYFRSDYLQTIIAAIIIAISSIFLGIVNHTSYSKSIKLIFFISSSVIFQLNILLYNIKAVLTF